jgi:hypothetical protein
LIAYWLSGGLDPEDKRLHRHCPLDKEGRLWQPWLDFFEVFPDRIVTGSDEILEARNDLPSVGIIQTAVRAFSTVSP